MRGKTKRVPTSSNNKLPSQQGKSNLKKLQINDPVNRNDKIMSALDKLGQKFIESEADRISMRKTVDDNFNAQKETERKLKKQSASTEKLEVQLNETVQENQRLRQLVEKSEKRQLRLQKRIERVESIASDAQAALEAKAMVLLTDRAIAHEAGMPYLPASGDYEGAPALENMGAHNYGAASQHKAIPHLFDMPAGQDDTPWWQRSLRMSTAGALGVILVAGLIGWSFSNMGSNNAPSTTFAIMQDGKLAQVNLATGEITPVMLAAKKAVEDQMTKDMSLKLPQAESSTASTITENGIPVPSAAKPTQAEQGENVEMQTATAAPEAAQTTAPEGKIEDRIKPDNKLTDDLKKIEDKAFKGNSEAQHDLAALYTAGQGVTQNYERAAAWFKEAANANIANASYNLGVLYHQGLGVSQDMPIALDWYRRAALEGHPEAQYNLGIAYIEGIGAKYNPHLASAYFRQAALNGIVEGAYNLGLILENGLLGQAYLEQAMVWYRAAADRGSSEAAKALETLAEKLGVDTEKAGLVNGDVSLASSMLDLNEIQPAAGVKTPAEMPNVRADFDLVLADYIPSWDQMILAEIQGQLTNKALYSGAQDGLMGPATAEAIKTYQTIEGIDISGKPSKELLQFMLSKATKENS